jgi:hypothetical protein
MTDEELKAIRERLHRVAREWTSTPSSTTPAERAAIADFIAAAPSDVSALLSDLDRSRTEIAALRRGIAAVRDDIVKADDPGSDVWIAALSALLR